MDYDSAFAQFEESQANNFTTNERRGADAPPINVQVREDDWKPSVPSGEEAKPQNDKGAGASLFQKKKRSNATRHTWSGRRLYKSPRKIRIA